MFDNNEHPVTRVELRRVSVDCLTLELETVTEKDREHYDEEDEHEDDEDKDEESTALLSLQSFIQPKICLYFVLCTIHLC